MHIASDLRKAYNQEPNYCWECYSCVKECPQHAIDIRGYADFAPLDHKLTVLRDQKKNSVFWKVKYRNGSKKEFSFPIRTTAWDSIKPAQSYEQPKPEDIRSQHLAHEPAYLKIKSGLPTINREPRE